MPTAGWWEALWPDPAGVLASVGLKSGIEVIDLCSGDGWFTLQIAKIARHVAAIDIDPTLLECLRQARCDGQHKKPDEARRIAANIAKLRKLLTRK